jgi:hypothetical protein
VSGHPGPAKYSRNQPVRAHSQQKPSVRSRPTILLRKPAVLTLNFGWVLA